MLPELLVPVSPQQGSLFLWTAWDIPWGSAAQIPLPSHVKAAYIQYFSLFPWVYLFCTQNTVNSWRSSISSLGSVQRMIKNSKELVLVDTDSLKVWRVPGSHNRGHAQGHHSRDTRLLLPLLSWSCLCRAEGLGTVTSSLHQRSGTDSFHLFILDILCASCLFEELFLSFCEATDATHPVFLHAAKCFSLWAGDKSLISSI